MGIEVGYTADFTFVSAEEGGYVVIPCVSWIGEFSFNSISEFNDYLRTFPFLTFLMDEFEFVGLYGSHRVSGYGYYAEIKDGRLIRAYECGDGAFKEFGGMQAYEHRYKKSEYNQYVKKYKHPDWSMEEFKKHEDYQSYDDYKYIICDGYELAQMCKEMTGLDQLALCDSESESWQLGSLIETSEDLSYK